MYTVFEKRIKIRLISAGIEQDPIYTMGLPAGSNVVFFILISAKAVYNMMQWITIPLPCFTHRRAYTM